MMLLRRDRVLNLSYFCWFFGLDIGVHLTFFPTNESKLFGTSVMNWKNYYLIYKEALLPMSIKFADTMDADVQDRVCSILASFGLMVDSRKRMGNFNGNMRWLYWHEMEHQFTQAVFNTLRLLERFLFIRKLQLTQMWSYLWKGTSWLWGYYTWNRWVLWYRERPSKAKSWVLFHLSINEQN